MFVEQDAQLRLNRLSPHALPARVLDVAIKEPIRRTKIKIRLAAPRQLAAREDVEPPTLLRIERRKLLVEQRRCLWNGAKIYRRQIEIQQVIKKSLATAVVHLRINSRE